MSSSFRGWCLLLLVTSFVSSGCSLRRVAAGKVGDLMASGGSGWSSDEDPELVREALPFSLKLMESLAAEAPQHAGLQVALCRGFTSYAAGFLEPDAERIESADFDRAETIRRRAAKMHLRARGHCFAAMEIVQEGSREELLRDPDRALARFGAGDLELLYWTGASWGSAISLALDRPDLVADLPTVRAIFERALTLGPDWDRGALHEAMIVFDSMPAMMGGSYERARAHFERAVELSGGLRASPFVTWARSSAVARQDRREYREALDRALAIDPEVTPADRLSNLISRARATTLLSRIDDFFFVAEDEPAATE
ncbi:MAG: TRAP transporter TatT component family protein [Thermoanaerobaculia bacterium]